MEAEKSGVKVTGKPRGRPIQKGQVLNPGGRPKKSKEEWDLIEACRKKAPEALEVMARIMKSGENERNQLAAAQAIIERAYGKALQPVEASGAGGGPLVVEIVRYADPTSE